MDKTNGEANKIFCTNADKLSKLSQLTQHKEGIMKEVYISKLSRHEASAILKGFQRQLQKKSKSLICIRCRNDVESDHHIFSQCPALTEIRKTLYITSNIELFEKRTTINRLRQLAEFILLVEDKDEQTVV